MNEWENLVRDFNTHHWEPVKDKTAILLVDCQEYFRGMLSPILDNITKIILASREMNIPLFFTQHGHRPDEDPNLLDSWWADIIRKDSNEARLLPELGIQEGDSIIPKNTYSAFHNTGLEPELQDKRIQDLVIGGVMTNLCCETSARDAFVRNFRVFFLVDGTATASTDYHLATLRNLSYGFATLLTCDHLIQVIKM